VITVRETPRKKPPPPPPPPPAPAIAAPTPAVKEQTKPPPKRVAKPPPATTQQAPTSAAPPPADTGLKLGNAEGGNGPSVAPPRETPTETPKPPTPKTLEVKPEGGCVDPIVKPRPKQVIQPAFTQEARDAGITGKVRVEITISTTGTVTAAKVIAGLGHGLDEAALEAARASTFEPATKCGAAVETTFTIGMRFQ
jgi:protein TonB